MTIVTIFKPENPRNMISPSRTVSRASHFIGINQPVSVRMTDTSFDLQTFKRVPLSALRLESRYDLARYLDDIKVVRTFDGYWRDWRGLLQLSGSPNYYDSFMSNMYPTLDMIQILENERDPVTFTEFRFMLGVLDRWDAFHETYQLFVDDALEYLKVQAIHNRNQQQLEEDTIRMAKEIYRDCLSVDDVILAKKGLPPQRYDALLLFAPADIGFASLVVREIEALGLKLFVKERDLLRSVPFEHDAIRHLLTERCARLVVILSPDFMSIPLNEYIANLAQSLGIAQGLRKLIPCLYKPCKLSNVYRDINVIDYNKSNKLNNFWKKLKMSLQTTGEERLGYCPPCSERDDMSFSDGIQSSTDSLSRSYRSIHQCPPPPNSVADSEDMQSSTDSLRPPHLTSEFGSLTSVDSSVSVRSYGLFGRVPCQCPPNSVSYSDQMSLPDDMQNSTDSLSLSHRSFRRTTTRQLSSTSDSPHSLDSSLMSYSSYQCPHTVDSSTDSYQMSRCLEAIPSSSDSSVRSYEPFRRNKTQQLSSASLDYLDSIDSSVMITDQCSPNSEMDSTQMSLLEDMRRLGVKKIVGA